MPQIFKGTTSTEVTSPTYTLPFRIGFFTIANKNAGTNTINLSVFTSSVNIRILPNNMQIDEGDFIEGDYEMIMPESSQIRLSVTGSVDYYFTIYNILPDDTGT